MRHNALFLSSALQPSRLLQQLVQRIKRPAHLEGADALQVLAFEPQSQHGLCGRLAGKSRVLEVVDGPRR